MIVGPPRDTSIGTSIAIAIPADRIPFSSR
jgi:hypothetical protein